MNISINFYIINTLDFYKKNNALIYSDGRKFRNGPISWKIMIMEENV